MLLAKGCGHWRRTTPCICSLQDAQSTQGSCPEAPDLKNYRPVEFGSTRSISAEARPRGGPLLHVERNDMDIFNGESASDAGLFWGLTPLLLAMVLLVLAHCSLTMSYESILPGISEDKLGAGIGGVSYLIAGVGAGALVASIFIAGVQSEVTRGRLFLIFGVTSGVGPILLALSSSRELSIAATVIMGMNQAGFMTISHAIIQSIVDDSVRGRVSGVYSMHVGGSMAVTNALNAVFADLFNAPVVLIAGGLIFLLVITCCDRGKKLCSF